MIELPLHAQPKAYRPHGAAWQCPRFAADKKQTGEAAREADLAVLRFCQVDFHLWFRHCAVECIEMTPGGAIQSEHT